MYTTREARASPVFNNMMYPYKSWYNNDYHAQYHSDTDDMDSTVITNTIERIHKAKDRHHNKYDRQHRQDRQDRQGKRSKSNDRTAKSDSRKQRKNGKDREVDSAPIYSYNDEGYPRDDLEDTYMEPLKYYGRGFNCKTMSPTKD